MTAFRPILCITLSLALFGLVLCAIAYGTNNWRDYNVNKSKLGSNYSSVRAELSKQFYPRNYGLFRECLDKSDRVGDRIGKTKVYKDPLGYYCTKPALGFKVKKNEMTHDMQTYVRLKDAAIGLYAVGLFLGFFGFFVLYCGCAITHAGPVCTAGFLLLLSACSLCAGVGCWHKAEDIFRDLKYLSKFLSPVNEYNSVNWIASVASATTVKYGWSYIINWVGIVLIVIAALLCLLGCFSAERANKKKEIKKIHKEYQEGGGTVGAAGSEKVAQAMAAYNIGYNTYGSGRNGAGGGGGGGGVMVPPQYGADAGQANQMWYGNQYGYPSFGYSDPYGTYPVPYAITQ